MAYSSIAIANRFIDLAENEGKKLTNMQLQKLVFIANGISLAVLDAPLCYHNIHAWQWGPVFPQLYKSFSKHGSNPIGSKANCDESIPESGDESDVIASVWKGYGFKSGAQLSALTHEPDSPWKATWDKNQYGIIPQDLIKAYYQKALQAA